MGTRRNRIIPAQTESRKSKHTVFLCDSFRFSKLLSEDTDYTAERMEERM